MMKRILSIVVFLFCLSAEAQLDESIIRQLNEEIPNCQEISYNSQRLIPKYYADDKVDSIREIYHYWQDECGDAAILTHLGVILDISEESFDPQEYPNLLSLLMWYPRDNSGYLYYSGFNTYYINHNRSAAEVETSFTLFLSRFAADVLEQGEHEPLERDILKYYAEGTGDIFKNMKDQVYRENALQYQLADQLQCIRYAPEMAFAVYGGAWIPFDNLAQLGTHPELGVRLGGYFQKMHFTGVVGLKFLDAPQDYRYRRGDSIYVSDHFLGGYIGAEVSRSLYRDMRNDIALGVGIAYDGFDIVQSDVELGIDGVTTGTLNTNIGFAYRYYYNFKDYLEFDVRYHFLNYRNNINNDFAGDALTLRLIWGFTDNTEKKRLLSKIHGRNF